MSYPDEFRITITSFYGRSYTLVLRDRKILYNATRPEVRITRDPAKRDWDKFWKKTVVLKIWLWDSEYVDKSSSDGINWSIKIRIGNLRLETYGSNSQPDNFGEFMSAVRELLPGIELG